MCVSQPDERSLHGLARKMRIALQWGASYNVAPQTFQPVVRLNRDTGMREIVLMRWGLIPYWSKDAQIGYSTINAKAETVATAPAFREAFRRRRCLVPADAFYEWQKLDPKHKQPFAIALSSREPYGFAGLWERWKNPQTASGWRASPSSPPIPTRLSPRCIIGCRSLLSARIMLAGWAAAIPRSRRSICCGLFRRNK